MKKSYQVPLSEMEGVAAYHRTFVLLVCGGAEDGQSRFRLTLTDGSAVAWEFTSVDHPGYHLQFADRDFSYHFTRTAGEDMDAIQKVSFKEGKLTVEGTSVKEVLTALAHAVYASAAHDADITPERIKEFVVQGKALHMVMPHGADCAIHAWAVPGEPGTVAIDHRRYEGPPLNDLMFSLRDYLPAAVA